MMQCTGVNDSGVHRAVWRGDSIGEWRCAFGMTFTASETAKNACGALCWRVGEVDEGEQVQRNWLITSVSSSAPIRERS